MGKSKELATGAAYVDTSGDTMTGALNGRSFITADDTSNYALMAGRYSAGYGGAVINTTSNASFLELQVNGYGGLRADSAGRVTMPYQAGFAAYSPATGTGGQNAIVYGATYHNIGNHYNTSTGIFTAPIAGRYLFTASCLFNYSSGAYHRLDFRLNGSVYNSYGETLENQAGPSYSSATISNIFTLNANDTMQMWNGSNTTTYGSSYGHFSGIMLA